MKIESDFREDSSKFGLKEYEFRKLDKEIKRKLVRYIARIMEKAYRRGVQHTLTLFGEERIDDWILRDSYEYRYGKSLEISIGLDGFTTTSIERLKMEEDLYSVGLDEG